MGRTALPERAYTAGAGGARRASSSEDTRRYDENHRRVGPVLTPAGGRIGLVVEGYPGQRPVEALARSSAAGEIPRIHYVEVARAVDADVIDGPYMATHASHPARLALRRLGFPAAQVLEAFLRRRRYSTLCAWSDRLGLPLALLHELARSRHDLVLVSQWPSRPKKAVFLRRLRVHTHLRAILNSSTYQLEFCARELGVPEEKLQIAYRPVDDRFWQPAPPSREKAICAVGWEARDYDTLTRAVAGLDVQVTIAVGMIGMVTGGNDVPGERERLAVLAPWKQTYGYALQEQWLTQVQREGVPPNVTVVYQLDAHELRELYARSRFVVVPLHDVDSNCGVTTVTEAMAMGRAVVVTRIRGQSDVIVDGHEGRYVQPRDAGALREAIVELLDHPDAADRMGRAGRALVEERHTMDRYVRQLADLLRDPGAPLRGTSRPPGQMAR
jgi:glycosyltransferase involved in cell wall biosynthesis